MKPSKNDVLSAARAELARRQFSAFKAQVYRKYQHAPHLGLIDRALSDAVRYVQTKGVEGQARTLINMPPRHGKTMTASRLFPPWVIGNHPDWRIIMASYAANLSTKNSRAARNLISSRAYQQIFPQIQLAQDSKAADAWDVQGHEGGIDAMGVGGGLTGKGAQIILIDDPVKNREGAESDTQRDKIWDWYRDDLYTRLEPHGALVIIMTRWHMDDLAGRLLKAEPHLWRVLSLPAINEAGAALWPERYDLQALRETERTLGPYSWSALYQQTPTPSEGGLFKRAWFQVVHSMPQIARAVRYWDLAMSSKTSADFTCGVKVGFGADGHHYVLDVVRKRAEWEDVLSLLAETAIADGPEVMVGIEEQAYMSRAVQALVNDGRLQHTPIYGYPKTKDKVTNALAVGARLAAGGMHLSAAHWNDAFIDELCSFPRAEHDDQVDALAGAWEMIVAQEQLHPEVGYADHAAFSVSDY